VSKVSSFVFCLFSVLVGVLYLLIQAHFIGDWIKVYAVVYCEAGGFVYTPVLAAGNNVCLALIRESGKLPPPTISVTRSLLHISSLTFNDLRE
jgi:adenine/guanine phosphoribosyltransferase-like PRPP-binding protein